jgi:hypothetical protein
LKKISGFEMIDLIRAFKDSAIALNEAWNWDEFVRMGCEDYPFENDFDSVTHEIINWVRSFEDEILR